MRFMTPAALAALALVLATESPVAAQADILLRLRSDSPAGDRFRVDSAGGIVARSFLGIGIIPQTGAGERLMWHPFKASFRVGGVSGTQWDDSNTGFYSFAAGNDVIAAGNWSIAAGYQSQTLQPYGVAMGYAANSDGAGAVSLGYRTTADANYSVALGYRASTNGHTGAVVIADASTTDSLEASANNQFSVRAAGGYRLYTNATRTTGVQLGAGGGSWSTISDRNRKQDFLTVDGDDVLARIRTLPVSTWRYVDEADRTVRHIGPMAQDWQAAFGFSQDSTTINTGDFDGVNLAAIQALDARATAQDARLQALEARNAELATRNTELAAQNARLEERLRRLETLLPAPAAP
jgi:hypothetical protein